MRVQNTVSNEHSSSAKKIAFKSRLIFDVGASDSRGSLKILVQDNKGSDLFEYKGFVNDTTKGFKSEAQFINRVARATDVGALINEDILSVNKQIKENHLSPVESQDLNKKLSELMTNQQIWKNRSASEKKLTGLALLLPGTLKGHTALFMANLKKEKLAGQDKQECLKRVDLDNIVKQAVKMGYTQLSDNFDLKKDFMPVKDIACTGIGIGQLLANNPIYKKRIGDGLYVVAVQTGGGFGAADIQFNKGSMVRIATSEGGHTYYPDGKTVKGSQLRDLGASTGSVIKNYAMKLGFMEDSDEMRAIKKTGLAQLATQSEIKMSKINHSDAIDALLKSGIYEKVKESADNITIKVKKINLEKYIEASKHAILSYADTLALHAVSKVNEGANLYVVSGPLAMGLNKSIQDNSSHYGVQGMRELILQLIDEKIGADVTCNMLREEYKFDVVCDKSMSIANNTPGGAILLSKENRPTAITRRGEWVMIQLKSLKRKIKI